MGTSIVEPPMHNQRHQLGASAHPPTPTKSPRDRSPAQRRYLTFGCIVTPSELCTETVSDREVQWRCEGITRARTRGR